MDRQLAQLCLLCLCRDRIAKSFARDKAAYDAAKSEKGGSASDAVAQQTTSKAVSQEAGRNQDEAEGDQSFTRHELAQHNTGDARSSAEQDQRTDAGTAAELATDDGSEEWGPRMGLADRAFGGSSREGGKSEDRQRGATGEGIPNAEQSKQRESGQGATKRHSGDRVGATDEAQQGATGEAVNDDVTEDWTR